MSARIPGFDPLFQRVGTWRCLDPLLGSRFSCKSHGDFERWKTALDVLPQLEAEMVHCGDRVTMSGAIGTTVRARLRPSLLALHPWRKGPFRLFGIDIDSEWRSDWKWQRVLPHLDPLTDRAVLDVGCGNGYFGWRMLQAGASLVAGIDPTLVFVMQHLAINHFARDDRNWVLPLRFEELPEAQFDTAFSMGVIYHRRNPQDHLGRLFRFVRPGGQVVVESVIVRQQPSLFPGGRYARMRNVWEIPSPSTLSRWTKEAGFRDVAVVDVTPTSTAEQRRTPWMRFDSLAQALDPHNQQLTVEGWPAPVRAIVTGRRPG